jgi:hypothetical protein
MVDIEFYNALVIKLGVKVYDALISFFLICRSIGSLTKWPPHVSP